MISFKSSAAALRRERSPAITCRHAASSSAASASLATSKVTLIRLNWLRHALLPLVSFG